MSLSQKKVAIVIPCFNEQDALFRTCMSLGFGLGKNIPEDNTFLILVNNNSTDSTFSIALDIQKNSKRNSVYILQENEQGFIPARHCGNLFLLELCSRLKIQPVDMLVLQVDADTIYGKDYIMLLKKTAESSESNILFEAIVGYPPSFIAEFPYYLNLCKDIDDQYIDSENEIEDDVIIDDKVSAYWLSDYFFWGGHKREYNFIGEEVYAETTRLFMRAKALGAKRLLISGAYAFHSPRKLIKYPLLHFATAGFPREKGWNQIWNEKNLNINLKDFKSPYTNQIILAAILCRKSHLLALFNRLPIHVKRACTNDAALGGSHLIKDIPFRLKADLLHNPAMFLADVLNFTC